MSPISRKNKVVDCLAHLIWLPGITVEDRDEVEAALSYCRKGIDFADALHLAGSNSCSDLLTFDNRGYARRAKKLRLKLAVRVPTAKQQIPAVRDQRIPNLQARFDTGPWNRIHPRLQR
jgi:hypothetical protein